MARHAVQIGFKIALSCLGIAALVAVVGWRSGVTNDAVRAEVEHIGHSSVRELMGATDMLLALETTRSAAQQLLAEEWRARFERRSWPDETPATSRLREAIQRGITTFDEQLQASRAARRPQPSSASDARRSTGSWRSTGSIRPRRPTVRTSPPADRVSVRHG